ncbi:hypothetical protein AB2N04_18415 [Nitratireductor sp. GISD-1A_MAKvit]|uniref:hypothetical protein n=1 Tax=Nitratireductor sp. GISD-1A_MAKvit TaxID=3234198 RepID=UPI0034672BA5
MSKEVPLEVVQLELLLSMEDLIAQGFETALRKVLQKLGGTVLFNRRLDGDPRFQRVAAVMVGPDFDAALVFLDSSGTGVHVEHSCHSDRMIAREAEKARDRIMANPAGERAAP